MFGSEIVDVAIGVLFMFLMLSLICSAANELLEALLKYRARYLERGISVLIGDSDNREHFLKAIYEHGLINGLYQGKYVPGSKDLPSYIPAENFALAILSVRGKWMAPLLPSNIQTAFEAFEMTAGSDFKKLQLNVETWYNNAMDRVSGSYKRRTQIIVAGMGFAFAVFVNADTIGFARYLSTDKSARTLIVSRAQASLPPFSEPSPSDSPLVRGVTPVPPSDSSAGSLSEKRVKNAKSTVPDATPSDLLDSLGWLQREGGIPFGWRTKPQRIKDTDNVTYEKQLVDYNRDWRKFPEEPSEWTSKFFGLLLTALAVSLGAPFWFDVLNKFMIVRSTIKPKEKSPEELSKA